MSVLVLDSGGFSALASGTPLAHSLIRAFRRDGHWPPVVPTAVLVESLTGSPQRDAKANLFLKTTAIVELPERVARRAAFLRTKARRGSAVDAIVVALAEPDGTVLTSDPGDLEALATHAAGVTVETI